MAMDGVSLEGLGPESPPFKYLKGTDTKSAQNVLKTHKNRGFRLIHKENEVFWVSSTASPLRTYISIYSGLCISDRVYYLKLSMLASN